MADWTGRSDGVPNPLTVTVPGDEVERAALGYLHVNCGASCHNDTAPALGRETGLFLNLDAKRLGSVLDTPAFEAWIEHMTAEHGYPAAAMSSH